MATLQELKNQIDAANELGVTNITKKGGTISSDATTAEIMAEIDNLPSGGGSAPTVVNEITWDGDTTGLESVTVEGGEPITLYKVSDSVLPYAGTISSPLIGYTTTYSDGTTVPAQDNEFAYFDFYLRVGGSVDAVCAFFNNYENVSAGEGVLVPSVGTWLKKDGNNYVSKVSVFTGN